MCCITFNVFVVGHTVSWLVNTYCVLYHIYYIGCGTHAVFYITFTVLVVGHILCFVSHLMCLL